MARWAVREPSVRTGDIIPAHAEIPVHYLPAGGRWFGPGRLIYDEHPFITCAVAGHLGVQAWWAHD